MNLMKQNYQDQARNQEFFRAWEVSWDQGTLVNIHLQHEKERPCRGKISSFFAWIVLKREILPIDDHNQGIFSPNQGNFFHFSKKGEGKTHPPLVTRLPYLSQRLDCYHEPNNAFDQFAIKMVMMEKKQRENCWGFTPKNLKAYEVSVSKGSSHTCRNILCKVQTFIFGTRQIRTIMQSICVNATNCIK